jgi:hypothetical protein
MEKINIVELLRDCPKGMELDCINYDGVVTFEEISNCSDYPIKITVKYNNECVTHTLTKYGQTCISPYNKCIIFPKGKTTWEGFTPPCQFKDWTIQDAKDGDVVSYDDGWTCIFKCIHGIWYSSYCFITRDGEFHTGYEDHSVNSTINGKVHLATKKEKKKFFQTIKDNGYKWNPETKKLEKLIKPYFKVWDKIRRKNDKTIIKTIYYVYHDSYALCDNHQLYFKEQDEWELVPNKFDVTTLKPFDKVLVRDFDNETWEINFFSRLREGKYFKCLDLSYMQCIPFKGNEHLYDTTNKCDEFYRTWESYLN